MNLVLPATDISLRNLATSRSPIPSYTLPYEIESCLVRVLMKEIEMIRSLELAKRELTNRYDFSIVEVFRTIDVNNSGYISTLELEGFLNKYKNLPFEGDIKDIMRRFDKDADNMISYDEFVAGIMPIDPYRYPEPVPAPV